LDHAPIEVAIVGDVSWEEARSAASLTLGALPVRNPRRDTTTEGAVRFAVPPADVQVFASDRKRGQAEIAWYFPVPDLADVHQERRCRLLAAIIADRLRVRLREELGAAYAPAANFMETEGFPAFSYFLVYADVDTSQATRAAQIIKREIVSLQASGLSADEFQRAYQPFVRQYDDSLRNNGYWCETVLADAQQRPKRLVAARDRKSDVGSITLTEIETLAQRYLDPDKGFLFVSEPPPVHFWGKK
jgi:zinc protease